MPVLVLISSLHCVPLLRNIEFMEIIYYEIPYLLKIRLILKIFAMNCPFYFNNFFYIKNLQWNANIAVKILYKRKTANNWQSISFEYSYVIFIANTINFAPKSFCFE